MRRLTALTAFAALMICLTGCSGTGPNLPPLAPGLDLLFRSIFGTSGAGPGQLSGPTDIAAADDNNVWVVDSGNNRVQLIHKWGNQKLEFGAFGSQAGQFSTPVGIAVSGSSLYVSDRGNRRVQEFTTSAGFVREFGSQWPAGGSLSEPGDVAAGGGMVAVADTQQHKVVVFTGQGVLQYSVGGIGAGDGQFLEVTGIEIIGNDLYVADGDRHDIQVFDVRDGTYLGAMGGVGSVPGQLVGPSALATDGTGLYVLEGGMDRIQYWSTTGAPMAVVDPNATPAGSLVSSQGLAAWRGGCVVAHTSGDRLVSFKLD